MKVNLQKIITLIFVSVITILFFNITVYADLESDVNFYYKTGKDVYLDTTNLCNSYINGDISYIDLISGLGTVVENATLSSLDYEANKVTSLINTLNRSVGGSEHGGGSFGGSRQPVTDIWNDICNKNNVPSETTKIPTTDLMGGGAKIVISYTNGNTRVITCSYAVVSDIDDMGQRVITIYSGNGECYQYDKKPGGEFNLTWHSGDSPSSFAGSPFFSDNGIIDGSGNTYKLYGDIRYSDGNSFPTDDEYEYGTLKKFDDMTDKELEELIDDFQTKLENENPDLDEVEDILRAIYWKLKQQEDDNITPDDLDSLINSAINRLLEKDCACGDILALLQDMKLCENVQDIRDKLFEIFPDYDFEENFSRIEYLKILLRAKFSFIDSIKNFVIYCFNEYSNTSENPEFEINYNGNSYKINFNAYKDFMPLIQCILAGYIYITYAYHTYRKIPSYINGGDNE